MRKQSGTLPQDSCWTIITNTTMTVIIILIIFSLLSHIYNHDDLADDGEQFSNASWFLGHHKIVAEKLRHARRNALGFMHQVLQSRMPHATGPTEAHNCIQYHTTMQRLQVCLRWPKLPHIATIYRRLFYFLIYSLVNSGGWFHSQLAPHSPCWRARVTPCCRCWNDLWVSQKLRLGAFTLAIN